MHEYAPVQAVEAGTHRNMEVVASTTDVAHAIPSGVQFSPDGLCVLTCVRDEFRLYNTHTAIAPEANLEGDPPQPQQQQASSVASSWSAALRCKGGDVVQSYDWYPHMTSNDAGTCCFLGTSREQPIHLYDAYYAGVIRATYAPYNPERDEPMSPLLAKFDATGSKLLCGGFKSDRFLHMFDTARPGRDSLGCYKLGKTRRSHDGQKGLVSSLCWAKNTNSNIFAVGTYSPGSIYMYDVRMSGEDNVAVVLHGGVSVVGHGKRVKRFAIANNNGNVDCDDDNSSNNNNENDTGLSMFSLAKAQWFQKRAQTGITQLEFCQSDHALLSASRTSDAVLKWDVRMMTAPERAIQPICGVKSYAANHTTNQRMEFHVHKDDDTLISIGDRDKMVQVYNIATGALVETIEVGDVVNGVSVHSDFMAVSLGERRFEDEEMVCQGNLQLLRRRRKSFQPESPSC